MPRSGARRAFQQLREFCGFWADERKHLTCCQFADQEALEHESDAFDCATCQVMAQLDGLDADNRRAWDLSHVVLTRFAGDARGVGLWVDRLTADLDEDDFADMLRRLSTIYDALVPASTRQE